MAVPCRSAEYEQNRDVTDPAAVDRLIDDAIEASSFISGHIVQGVLNERGNLSVDIDKSQVIPAEPPNPKSGP